MKVQAIGLKPLDPEDGGCVISRNVGNCLPVDTVTLSLQFILKKWTVTAAGFNTKWPFW
jgi:hypothetical protein